MEDIKENCLLFNQRSNLSLSLLSLSFYKILVDHISPPPIGLDRSEVVNLKDGCSILKVDKTSPYVFTVLYFKATDTF